MSQRDLINERLKNIISSVGVYCKFCKITNQVFQSNGVKGDKEADFSCAVCGMALGRFFIKEDGTIYLDTTFYDKKEGKNVTN